MPNLLTKSMDHRIWNANSCSVTQEITQFGGQIVTYEPTTSIYPDSDKFSSYLNIHFNIIFFFTALISSNSKQEDCSTITECPYGWTHWHPLPYARAPLLSGQHLPRPPTPRRLPIVPQLWSKKVIIMNWTSPWQVRKMGTVCTYYYNFIECVRGGLSCGQSHEPNLFPHFTQSYDFH
jgi:hypothetical protein